MGAVSVLSACADRASSPWFSTFRAVFPGDSDTSQQAEAIPYASIDLTIGRAGGLLILAEQSDTLTFWQSSQRETIVLRNGYIESTRGLQADLLGSQIGPSAQSFSDAPWVRARRGGDALTYKVERSWRDASGEKHAGRAQARFACASEPEQVELPLATFTLDRCVEELHWESGAQTRSVLWRDPDTHRIWAADAVAWPNGIRVEWQVARPWW